MEPVENTTELELTNLNPLDQLIQHLRNSETNEVKAILLPLHGSEIASLLESLPRELRKQAWECVPSGIEGEVLGYLGEEARNTIIDQMNRQEVVAAAETMHDADLADVIEELSEPLGEAVLRSLDEDRRKRIEATQAYAEDSVGRWMSNDVISVRQDVSLQVVLRYLRRLKPLPSHTDALMVIDEGGHYLGKLSLAEVVTEPPETLVSELMRPMADCVRADANEHDVAVMFERRDLISAAVISEQGLLLGRVTVDDAIDMIRSEGDKAILARDGLNEAEDLFAPVLPSAKRRALWLGINLITVFLAAWVIGRFEEALDKIVALAVLMPVVASMGGIAGSQTLTLTIRGLALGQVSTKNLRWLSNKELAVGLLNGITWAIVVAIVTFFWFGELGIALVIALAMVFNLIAAAISGVAIPFILNRLGFDPALSGAVVLTTVTDIVGFVSFLGLATLYLL